MKKNAKLGNMICEAGDTVDFNAIENIMFFSQIDHNPDIYNI